MSKIYQIGMKAGQPLEAVLDDDGLLRISGPGQAAVYTVPEMVPWRDERDAILAVEFADDVTVTDLTNWFWGCSNLSEIRNWPKATEKMQATCCDCHRLASIPGAFPETLKDLDECFVRCYALPSVPAIPAGVVYAVDTFVDCCKLSGHVEVLGGLTQYAYMFQDAGTDGDGIIVDYAPASADVIDRIVATGTGGKVSKGNLLA